MNLRTSTQTAGYRNACGGWSYREPRVASSVVEHLTFNQGVLGSIPRRPTTFPQ